MKSGLKPGEYVTVQIWISIIGHINWHVSGINFPNTNMVIPEKCLCWSDTDRQEIWQVELPNTIY